MKKLIYLFALALLLLGSSAVSRAEAPLWLRYPAISPDGSTIAFTYKGDIYTVPSTGGKATAITTNPAHDTHPTWSPDGTKLAFASNRYGNMDIYIVGSTGGHPTRVTTHSTAEYPITFKDNGTLLYSANIQPSALSVQFPSGFAQVYSVAVEGALDRETYKIPRPVMFSTLPMEYISFSADGGSFMFNDYKGYEDPWRKHHTSSITRDVWFCTTPTTEGTNPTQEGSYSKATTFKGEDRNPILNPEGDSFYFLSEQDGTFNVYKSGLIKNSIETRTNSNDASSLQQITKFKGNPVRFLTASKSGELCFGYDGEIYTLASDSAEPTKVKIEITSDNLERDLVKRIITSGAKDMALSRDGKQIAFIYHGDVYVTSTEYKTTKRITNSAVQERNVDFAPDGRSIIYSSERGGLWQVYEATIVNDEEKLFPYSTEIAERCLTNSEVASFQPLYSPDGKEVAFLENRTEIKVLNLKSNKVRTVMSGVFGYSYSDGDQHYRWSPDSKWILSNSITTGGWTSKDIVLLDASGNGTMHNLTKSGYSDGSAKWVLDGKAMLWSSDRAGYRSHGSWGSQSDYYIMFFDLDAYERFLMTKEEIALEDEAKKEETKKKAQSKEDIATKEKKGKKGKGSKKDSTAVKALTFDLANAENRVIRLTNHSSMMGDAALCPKGEKLYYLTRFEGGMDLWIRDLKDNSTKILVKNAGYSRLHIDSTGTNIYLLERGKFKKIALTGGKQTPLPFEAVFEHKPFEERAYIFEHAWQQVEDKFYDPTIHGIDWEGYRATYAKFLPHITNNYDFAEMLGEMLGELNGSHTGARYRPKAELTTAALGIFADPTYTGDGLRIAEIIEKSPLNIIKSDVKVGSIIEKIDGAPITASEDYFPLLEGKGGKKVVLSIYDPATDQRFNTTIKALNSESSILYDRWVKRGRLRAEELSGGKIGYIHIKGMNSASFRVLYSELLGRNRQKDAVVVDTRHNGGGWLHDDVITLLNGKEYQKFMPRGQYIGTDPLNKWTKPSAMLVCENNYSNAHGTPWLYKEMDVGQVIGTSVPGTMTAVWWETQIDPTLIFGTPIMGCMDNEGRYLENLDLEPDVEVYNTYEQFINGVDNQLEVAVKSLMK